MSLAQQLEEVSRGARDLIPTDDIGASSRGSSRSSGPGLKAAPSR